MVGPGRRGASPGGTAAGAAATQAAGTAATARQASASGAADSPSSQQQLFSLLAALAAALPDEVGDCGVRLYQVAHGQREVQPQEAFTAQLGQLLAACVAAGGSRHLGSVLDLVDSEEQGMVVGRRCSVASLAVALQMLQQLAAGAGPGGGVAESSQPESSLAELLQVGGGVKQLRFDL